MNKQFSLPIRHQLFVIVLCMAVFSMGIIVYDTAFFVRLRCARAGMIGGFAGVIPGMLVREPIVASLRQAAGKLRSSGKFLTLIAR